MSAAAADDAQEDLLLAILTISGLVWPLTAEDAEKCERELRTAHFDEKSKFCTDAAYRSTTMQRAIWIVREVRPTAHHCIPARRLSGGVAQ